MQSVRFSPQEVVTSVKHILEKKLSTYVEEEINRTVAKIREHLRQELLGYAVSLADTLEAKSSLDSGQYQIVINFNPKE